MVDRGIQDCVGISVWTAQKVDIIGVCHREPFLRKAALELSCSLHPKPFTLRSTLGKGVRSSNLVFFIRTAKSDLVRLARSVWFLKVCNENAAVSIHTRL